MVCGSEKGPRTDAHGVFERKGREVDHAARKSNISGFRGRSECYVYIT